MNDQNSEPPQDFRDWLAVFSPDAPVVVVPVFNAYDDVLECVESLLTTTRLGTPILILDDASTDDRIPNRLAPLSRERGFAYERRPANAGFVSTVNLAFDWCAPRDVVIVNSDVVVPPEWLERLQSAAYFRTTIATATPLTNHGSIVSVPYRDQPINDLVGGATVAEVDARIRAASLKLKPIIPTAIGHCIYFKRSALDTVGHFDEAFSPGYGEEVDWSQRAVAASFSHVVADDVFVFHKGSRSFDPAGLERRQNLQNAYEQIIDQRYPWYRQWRLGAFNDLSSPLSLAIERARAALLGYRIAVDATRVDGTTTGTQVLTLELIRALATAPDRRDHLAMIISDTVQKEALFGVDQLVDKVLRASDLVDMERPPFDLIHRPFQVFSVQDLALLKKAATRFIVSQLDSIAYANPSYTRDPDEWARYLELTRLTFSQADGIAFISHDAAQDAVHQGLHVPQERSCVTHVGVDHLLHSAPASLPAEYAALQDQPFILVLGTNFRHKNRVYALRLFRALVQKHEWLGHLVFAGPNVSSGGSEAEEEAECARSPGLQPRIHYLGNVTEPEKRGLLENAALLLYPSIYEGFGMVPFEAAAVGTPALTTRTTSLSEVLGNDVVYLEYFNPEQGAQVAWSLLSDSALAARQVAAIRARAVAFKWADVAERTWGFYHCILEMLPRSHALDRFWLPVASAPPVEKNWVQRIVFAFRVLFTGGAASLWKEVKQYLQWRFGNRLTR